MADALTPRMFDERTFAAEIQAAEARFGSMRKAAEDARVDAATFSRARNGWATLSHENWLRLRNWMDSLNAQQAA